MISDADYSSAAPIARVIRRRTTRRREALGRALAIPEVAAALEFVAERLGQLDRTVQGAPDAAFGLFAERIRADFEDALDAAFAYRAAPARDAIRDLEQITALLHRFRIHPESFTDWTHGIEVEGADLSGRAPSLRSVPAYPFELSRGTSVPDDSDGYIVSMSAQIVEPAVAAISEATLWVASVTRGAVPQPSPSDDPLQRLRELSAEAIV
ncbi:hypothetical protein ACFSBZ_08405 [Amnibacterium flavum]|uniref:Uncharacterized protein n=1 Tax=Amnibacterium flavum TaxID=2173173 RepID=A0A2V1HL78_9MICO|nr:hypothetical protein [Amnibacterium flavum]PVZ93383.1 hypothetical protein DDQ50_15520 [Amnibacterium flavum]